MISRDTKGVSGKRETAWAPPCAALLVFSFAAASLILYDSPRQLQARSAHLVGLPGEGKGSLAGAAPPAAAAWLPAEAQRRSQQLPQQQAPQQCQLNIQKSHWGDHCQRLNRVCVDQGQLIFHEERHQAVEGREPDPLPQIAVHHTRLFIFPWKAAIKRAEGSPGGGGNTASGGGSGSRAQLADSSGIAGSGRAVDAGAGAKEADWGQGGADGADSSSKVDGGNGTQGTAAGQTDGAAARRRRLRTQAASQPRRSAHEHQAPGEHSNRRVLPPIPTRPASGREPTAYLAAPAFSTCTVPIVVFPIYADNFAHLFHDVGAFMHSLLRRTRWRQHAKLVMMTPEGLALTQPETTLLPVLSNLSVQSWADFSRRLPPGYEPQADSQQPPASFEGGERRCFEWMYVCGRKFRRSMPLKDGLPLGEAEELKQLRKSIPRENFGFGQAVVQYYTGGTSQQGHGTAQQQQQQPGDSGSSGNTTTTTSYSSSSSASSQVGRDGRPLRVRFMRRDSGGRQLLNISSLLDSCNAWRYQLPGGGGTVTADCRQVELPDLQAGIAAAQEADVFVGVHGANMANSYMMRPGSSTVEITPYEFGRMGGSFGPSIQNAQDASSQLLWWSAVVCDPSLSQPGPDEAAGREPSRWWPRDRSARLPWPVLQAVLEEVVAVGGDRQRYIEEYWTPGMHRFHFAANGVVSRGNKALCAAA